MNTESSISKDADPLKHKVFIPNSLVKKLFNIGLTLLAVWVLVFTTVWSYVTDFGIHRIYELATSIDSDSPDFRDYVKQNKILGNLCDASNWVANKTRPIVSDEVLVALWEAKHVQWEEIARHAKPGFTDLEKTEPHYSRAVGLKGVRLGDSEIDKGQVFIGLAQDIGRLSSGRACKGKGGFVVKQINYYNLTPPVIYKNHVMRQSDFDYYEKAGGKPPWPHIPGTKLVGNTDLETNEFKVARMLNDRWFIVHHTLKD